MHSSVRSRVGGRRSITLMLSYVFDWIIIIIAAVVGGIFSIITPNKRPFSVVDPNISFPYQTHEKVSTATLIVCGLLAPAVIIFIITILLVPGPTVPNSTPKALIWRRKLWEWHTGWLGLGLSLAAAWLITDGMKNLIGKPRPDLLARCIPNIANLQKYAVGGYPQTQEGFLLVTAAICQTTDTSMLNDGFRSFPSGHASFSAAGLLYLSLFICCKLAIGIPFLAPAAYSSDRSSFSAFPSRAGKRALQREQKTGSDQDKTGGGFQSAGHNQAIMAARSQAAAPPVYLLAFAVIPFFAAIYISSTRWSDFRHHGFDILFGFFIGSVTAIFAFRYYHLPISQGAGWSWGPRSQDRAFWAGVGVGTYVGGEDKVAETEDLRMTDLEALGDGANDERRTQNTIVPGSNATV